MRVLLPNRSFRTVALCPLDTRQRRKALRPRAVIKTIAGRRRSDFSPPTELFAAPLREINHPLSMQRFFLATLL